MECASKFHQLVNHNDDLRRLLEKGYAIKFDSEYLVVRDIPYLDQDKACRLGAIVTKLTFVDQVQLARPDDHQVFFCGSHPHNIDGSPMLGLGGGPAQLTLTDNSLVVERSFSNKPAGGFANFFDKIESYATIVSGPATYLHGKTPLTFRVDENVTSGSVFKFHDTLTSRAEIGDLAAKLGEDVIAVIGLGGTGAYILDFMIKAPVKEIRGFDRDAFHAHNAFRSPGRLLDQGELGKTKAEVYQGRYDNFRHGFSAHAMFIDATSASELDGVTFAFVSVDTGPSRAAIFDALLAKGIPFIDVGMGLNRKRGALSGMIRVTYYSADRGSEIRAMKLAAEADEPEDEYRKNIQLSELNAINAGLAVLKYKQVRGFYVDDDALYHLLLSIEDFQLAGASLR
ncbi:MAG: ThiF family adenylyltransferase [Polyangiaceae bacterium]